MSFSDKNRKILWAKSGNRCAICRQKLVIDKTSKDSEAVVGEECHIISESKNGPRYDASFPTNEIDDLENLILLCGTHHKMVDDQSETYSTILLKQIKNNHEAWVETKFKDASISTPTLRRFENNIPKQLQQINSGVELYALASGCRAFYYHHDDDLNDNEIEMVGGFFQEMRDWADLASDMEPIDVLRAKKRMNDLIQELKASKFLVFGDTEIQRLEGGVLPPSNWKTLHLSVMRESNPSIVRI